MMDTGDVVQEVLIRALNNVDRFDNRGAGALFGYLRQAILNRLRDEARRVSRASRRVVMGDLRDFQPSPLDELLGREAMDRFEAALQVLDADEQAAVVARIEMGLTYPGDRPRSGQAVGRCSADVRGPRTREAGS